MLYTMGSSLDTFPVTTQLSVTVTADDGITDLNTYSVKWHLPYGKKKLIETKKTKHSIQTRCEGAAHDFPVQVQDSKPQEFDFGAGVDGLLLFVPEGAQTKGMVELLGKICEMNKWEYEYGGETSSTQFACDYQNYKDAVKEQKYGYKGVDPNYPAALGPDPNNYWLCSLAVKVMEHDCDKSWYADGYILTGFDGNSTHVLRSHVIDEVMSERFFTQTMSPGGGPPPIHRQPTEGSGPPTTEGGASQ